MIFSTHPLHPAVAAQMSDRSTLVVASAPTSDAILAESVGAEIIVVRAPINPEIIRREERLRATVRHGAGLDMIPVDIATAAGVLVANVPGANAITVAEHVIWTSLALLRKHRRVSTDLRSKGWAAGRHHSDSGRELSGRTLGIVGMGNVGRALSAMATKGFGMQVLTHTRSPTNLPKGVVATSLAELLSSSDIVALCCPLNEQTRGMINADTIAGMKNSAILINVSRGPVVEEMPLIEALRTDRLGGAALDVFDTQPLPPDHPYFDLDNVILTPHMAGITEESMLRMGQGVASEVRRILADELPENLVNPDAVARYRERFPTGQC
ncbi:MAG: NAD(P)-binding domain-containing protein [Alphaproteobacteria bacterium]|nr:NAD(P)-binding domain-containing protein [Alphaproteobacteria bacterium]